MIFYEVFFEAEHVFLYALCVWKVLSIFVVLLKPFLSDKRRQKPFCSLLLTPTFFLPYHCQRSVDAMISPWEADRRFNLSKLQMLQHMQGSSMSLKRHMEGKGIIVAINCFLLHGFPVLTCPTTPAHEGFNILRVDKYLDRIHILAKVHSSNFPQVWGSQWEQSFTNLSTSLPCSIPFIPAEL